MTFASSPETADHLAAPKAFRHLIRTLAPEDRFNAAALGEGPVDLLVIDHYGVEAGFETASRKVAKRIMVIDDLADRPHDCDILLNQAPGAVRDLYDGLLPETCQPLMGAGYALLRPQFGVTRRNFARRNPSGLVERILVTMGGTDPTGASVAALRAIGRVGRNISVDLILGAGGDADTVVPEAAYHDLNLTLHRSVTDMASLIGAADLAVVSAGVSLLEVCCLGRPTVAVILADNQRANGEALATLGAGRVVDAVQSLDVDGLTTALLELVGDPDARCAAAAAASAACDGLGVERTLSAIAGHPTSKAGQPVRLEPAGHGDGSIILAWQRAAGTREFARNREIPSAAEHFAWFEGKLANPHSVFNIIMHGDTRAGFVRLDRIDGAGDDQFEVSVVVAPDHLGQGVGDSALATVHALLPHGKFEAFVMPDNLSSHRLFQAAGYQRTEDRYFFSPATAGLPDRVGDAPA